MANYPAPVLAADRPIGVAAPGDAFVLPSNVTGGSTKGNVVAEWHRQVSAGEKFGLTGLGLAGASFPMYSGGKFYTTATAGDAEKAEILFPNYGQAWDFALAWVAASDGVALPIALNRSRILWLQNVWTPGITVNIYGENLAHNNKEGGAAYVAVQAVGGGEVSVYPATAANCLRVPFTVPSLTVGEYYVWEHNGHGGDFGWSRRMKITVVAPENHVLTANFGTPVYVPLSATDEVANTAALVAAMNHAGAIETDAGPWPINDNAAFRDRVKWRCKTVESGGITTLVAKNWVGTGNLGMCGSNSASFVFLDGIEFTNPDNLVLGTSEALVCLANVYMWRWRRGKARWTMPYTERQAGPVMEAVPVQPLRIKTSSNIFLDDLTFTGSGSFFTVTPQLFITNFTCYATNNADYSVAYGLNQWQWSIIGGTFRDLNATSGDGATRGIRLIKGGGQGGRNKHRYLEGLVGTDLGIVTTGTNVLGDVNQYEQLLDEGNLATGIYPVTAATATTVTTSGNLTNKAVPNYHLVAIVKGLGMGQMREIVSSTGFSITIDEPWNLIPDSTSVFETGVFAQEHMAYNINLGGKQENSVNPAYNHSAFWNLFGGCHGFIGRNFTGSYFRQMLSVVATQHTADTVDQSAFNAFYNCVLSYGRWGLRAEAVSGNYAQKWLYPAIGLLQNLYQNISYPNTILAPLVFQFERSTDRIGVTPCDGLILNGQPITTGLNDFAPSFVDDPQYPPVAPLPQALKNFTQAIAQPIVSQVTIPAGQYPFSYLGATTLVLSQQPWWVQATINKIYAVNANRQGYTSGRPGSNLGVTQLAPATNASDPLPGYVLDVKAPFQVDSSLFGGLPASSGVQLAAPVLGQPTNITASSATIAWSAVSGADSYRVRLNGSTLYMPGNTTTYTVSGLTAATTFNLDVQALDSTSAKQPSAYSNVVIGTTNSNLTPVPVVASRIIQSNGSGLARQIDLASNDKGPYTDTIIWNDDAGVGQPLQIGVNEAGLNGGLSGMPPRADGATVPAGLENYYDGYGMEHPVAKLWGQNHAGQKLYYFKINVEHVNSTQSSTMQRYIDALFSDYQAQWNRFVAWLATQGLRPQLIGVFDNQGEAENDNSSVGVSAGSTLSQAAFISLRNQLGRKFDVLYGTTAYKIFQVRTRGASNQYATVGSWQAAFAAQDPRVTIYDDPSMTYLSDGVHTDSPSMEREGQAFYYFATGETPPANTVPTITSFAPNPAVPGTQLVITGTNFASGASVRLGLKAVTSLTVNSATQLTAQVPNGAGIGYVEVVIPNGGTATRPGFIGHKPLVGTASSDLVKSGDSDYTTTSTDGTYNHVLMGTQANTSAQVVENGLDAIISIKFTGIAGPVIFGLHNAATPGTGVDIFSGAYIEPLSGGGAKLFMINNGTTGTLLVPVMDTTLRYAVARVAANGNIIVVSNDGTGWSFVNGSGGQSTMGQLWGMVKMLGQANNLISDVRQNW